MNRRVLFVDDEPQILLVMQRLLRGKFELAVAGSGAEALALIERGPPFAVVISDLRMPGMDGLELLARVRQIAPETVRVLLTGGADATTSGRAARECGVFRILPKPSLPSEVALAIEEALQRYAEDVERDARGGGPAPRDAR